MRFLLLRITSHYLQPLLHSTRVVIEITFVFGSEMFAQRQYNDYFLISSINEYLKIDKAIAARKLLNGDIIIIFDSEISKKTAGKITKYFINFRRRSVY